MDHTRRPPGVWSSRADADACAEVQRYTVRNAPARHAYSRTHGDSAQTVASKPPGSARWPCATQRRRFRSEIRELRTPFNVSRQAASPACQDVSDDDRLDVSLLNPLRFDRISYRRVPLRYPYRARVARLWLSQAHAREWVALAYYFLLVCCSPKQAQPASGVLIASSAKTNALMAIRRIISRGGTKDSRSKNRRRHQRGVETITDPFATILTIRPACAFADPYSGGKSAMALGLRTDRPPANIQGVWRLRTPFQRNRVRASQQWHHRLVGSSDASS